MATAMTGRVPRTRSAVRFLLRALLLFQGVSALFGGGSLVLDPSGGRLGLETSLLANTPFPDYLIPGLVLLIVLGVLPLVTFGASFLPPRNPGGYVPWLHRRLWLLGSLAVGIGLVIWIGVQGWMLGFGHWLQVMYLAVGLVITALALWLSLEE